MAQHFNRRMGVKTTAMASDACARGAQHLIVIRQLIRRAMVRRHKSGGGGKVGACAYVSAALNCA
jgi:hypothetical protein